MEELQHIIIGGSPRSGSTALTELLAHQKSIFVTNEFGIYNHWDDLNKWEAFEKAKDFSSFRANEKSFANKGVDLDKFLQTVIDEKMSGKDVFCWIKENIPSKFYGDKCPMSYLENISVHSEKFPNAKFIITMRDGRDVITSQIANFQRVGKAAHWMHPTIEEAEYLWLDCVKKTMEHLNDVRVLLWKYEDTTLEELSDFIGSNIVNYNDMFQTRSTWQESHVNMMDRLSNEFKEYLERFEYI